MVELITDYLEGSLSWRERRRFGAHLSGCDHCTEFLRQIHTTIALTGSLAADDLSPVRQSELLALFQRWCLDTP
jgi:anti-sigma factor ChrR (cupin superfamily)